MPPPPPPPPPRPQSPTVTCPLLPPPLERHSVFTCTFCWHISLLPPRVVGRSSARLACQACHDALVTLSICWVCGEVVVRGDDCVSLGWCFWHKSCYGCLICGNRMVVRGWKVAEVFGVGEDREGEDKGEGEEKRGGDSWGMGKAVEIDVVPLCAHCYVEVGAEEMDEGKVVGGALRRMEYRDGGLSRRRYEDVRARADDKDRERADSGQELEQVSGGRDDLVSGLGDGSGMCPVPLDSTIYVSIRDPTAPTFRPSPTKPIPRWMTGAPAQQPDTEDHGLQSHLEPVRETPPSSQAELSLRKLSTQTASSDRTAKPHTPTPEPRRHLPTPESTPRRAVVPIVTPQPIPMDSHKVFRYSRLGFVNSESLKRPSSRLDRVREESNHADSRTPSPYLTPPEWPTVMYDDSRSARQLEYHDESSDTVVQGADNQTLARLASKPWIPSSSSSRLSSLTLSPTETPPPTASRLPRLSVVSEPGNIPQHSRLPRKSTMLRAKISTHHQPLPTDAKAIPMSSEFLERYGLVKGSPKATQKPSALLKKTPPSSRRQSHSRSNIHSPESFMSRMTRNSRAGATTGLVDATTVVTGTERSDTSKQFSFDSATRSIALHDGSDDRIQMGVGRSLQAELRRWITDTR